MTEKKKMTTTGVVESQGLRDADGTPLVSEDVLDELMGRVEAEGAELLGPDGLLSQVTKAVLERALNEELTDELGYEKHDPAGRGSGNSRNGTMKRPGICSGSDSTERWRDASTKEVSPGVEGAGDPARS
jgi:hypothetical protein